MSRDTAGQDRRLWAAAALILLLIGTIALYAATLQSGVQPADSGEFQWVAARLLLAHPPGFPLYTLVAHLFSRLTPEPATGVTIFSTVTSVATLLVVYWIVLESGRQAPVDGRPRGRLRRADVLGGLVAALALATSTTFWAQATTANIRSLTTLFAALAFAALFRFLRPGRPTLPFFLAAGLGLTHHLSLAFMAAVMGLWLLAVDRRWLRSRRRRGEILLAAVVALLPLVYLPLRDPALRSWASFAEYALGLGFQGDFFYFRTPAALFDRLAVMIDLFRLQFNPLLLLGGLAGWLLLLVRRRPVAVLLGATFAVHLLVSATYRAPQTVEYLLPAYLPLAICLGVAAAWLAGISLERGALDRRRLLAAGGLALLTAMTAVQGIARYPSFRWLAESGDTYDYTQVILDRAPAGALVLADWHWYTPLAYRQAVTHWRPDLEIRFVFPRTADYGADWAAEIAAGLAAGRPVVATHFDEGDYAALPPLRPLGEAFLFPQAPLNTLPAGFTPLDRTLGGEIRLTGYRLSLPPDGLTVAGSFPLEVAWEPLPGAAAPPETVRLTAQLLAGDGRPAAQLDLLPPRQPAGLSVARFRLTPYAGFPPGRYRLHLGGYLAGGGPLPVDDGGETLLPLAEIELAGSRWRPVTGSRTLLVDPDSGRTLIGTDWDTTLPDTNRLYLHWLLPDGTFWSETRDLPPGEPFVLDGLRRWGFFPTGITLRPQAGSYVPFEQGLVWLGSRPLLADLPPLEAGDEVRVTQRFGTARPLERDIALATRLIGLEEDGVTWGWINPDPDDDIPGLGALPTLKWIAGTRVGHPRRLTIPPEAEANQPIEGFLRPYETFTNRPLAMRDERLANRGRPWVPFDRGQTAAP